MRTLSRDFPRVKYVDDMQVLDGDPTPYKLHADDDVQESEVGKMRKMRMVSAEVTAGMRVWTMFVMMAVGIQAVLPRPAVAVRQPSKLADFCADRP